MGWGISPNAEPKEKIKAEMNDFLQGLNSCGNISYSTYSEIFDFSMNILDKMYELGKIEASKTINIKEVKTFDNRKISK